ncbi:unnamed protein product [Trichobilharzia szidati]|nr:unnamed protein product [Trichobilharzia szidati]
MDFKESSDLTELPAPDYSADTIDVTTSDSESKPVLSPSNHYQSKETSESTQKTRSEITTYTRNMNEIGDVPDDSEDFDIEDESIAERLIGLTEMFPEPVRHAASVLFDAATSGIESAYSISRSVTWFLASTATLCFLPLILELERVQTEEQEAVQQRTMMLGPRAAGGGSGLAGFTASVPHLTSMEPK